MKANYLGLHYAIAANKDLCTIYNWYLRNCTSLTLPYHNLRHTLGMMSHIDSMLTYHQWIEGKNDEVNLDRDNFLVLLTSALFHDYNHSGGRFSDETNIKNAIRGLKCCLEETQVMGSEEERTRFFEECKSAIEATQYPYVIEDKDLTPNQRVLRELDILVCFYDDFLTHTFFGLMEEMKCKDIKDFAEAETEFLRNSLRNLKLEYCKEVIADNITEFNNVLELFKGIIKNG